MVEPSPGRERVPESVSFRAVWSRSLATRLQRSSGTGHAARGARIATSSDSGTFGPSLGHGLTGRSSHAGRARLSAGRLKGVRPGRGSRRPAPRQFVVQPASLGVRSSKAGYPFRPPSSAHEERGRLSTIASDSRRAHEAWHHGEVLICAPHTAQRASPTLESAPKPD